MSGWRRLATSGVMVLALAATLAGCSSEGDLEITNSGPDEVTVDTGDEVTEVSAGGGAVLLDYGCTPGDVTVEFESGETVVVAGPVCPDQRIAVGDGEVELEPASVVARVTPPAEARQP